MNVIVLPEVLDYLEELVIILYEKEYFSFLETSRNYVKELLVDIKTTLPTRLHKSAPKYFNQYGRNMKYAAVRKNKQTTWYAFFNTYKENGETFYLVRYISNNHVIAKYL